MIDLTLFKPAFSGFLLGASLIIAIGAQNAFILRMGLLKQNVFVLTTLCGFSDAFLIALGVGGFGTLIRQFDVLIQVITWAGAAFLFVYGFLAFKRAWQASAMTMGEQKVVSLKVAVGTCLALTFLNPHVYLDTVLLLGGISASYEGTARLAFGIGACIASFSWFYALGYGARLLAPLFAKPIAWRILDFLIGCIMWAIAASLLAFNHSA